MGVAQLQPSWEVCRTQSAAGSTPTSCQQVGDADPAPPGVADQAATDLVAHAVEGDPGLGDLSGDEVGVAQGELAVHHAVDADRPLLRLDGGLRDGRVDQVEVLVGCLPRGDAGQAHRRGRRRLGTGHSRQPQQPAADLDVATTGPHEASRQRDPDRGHTHGNSHHDEDAALGGLEVGAALFAVEGIGQRRVHGHPGHQPHQHRQHVDQPGAALQGDGKQAHGGQREPHREGTPPRLLGQRPGQREGTQEEEQDAGDERRLVVVAEDVDRLFGHGAGSDPDDHLGDRDHGRLADRQHHRGRIARRQSGEPGKDSGQPPRRTTSGHPAIVSRARA